jgi:ADP-ribose pyrophosphatase YjhB (NUDIX family)/nicotinamide mononucleotide adenylyltransferase
MASELIIFVGSSKRVQTIKNPFTFEEREGLIEDALRDRFNAEDKASEWTQEYSPDVMDRVKILPLRDYMYNDGKWVSEVYAKATAAGAPSNHNTCLIGCFKDDSSYYLEMFPKWSFEQVPLLRGGLSSTEIRERMFESAWALGLSVRGFEFDLPGYEVSGFPMKDVLEHDPTLITKALDEARRDSERFTSDDERREIMAMRTLEPVADRMEDEDVYWLSALEDPFGFGGTMARSTRDSMSCWTLGIGNVQGAGTRTHLIQEHAHYRDYKEKWANAPYKPTFNTVDVIAVKSGCVLLVKRGMHPGKGLWALPGGFLNPDEKIREGALRELREETSLSGHHDDLEAAIEEMKVYDHPKRSLRGRTITFCHLMDLGYGQLPDVESGSDADHVEWVPLADVWQMEGQFFEDHMQMLHDMLSRY